MAQQAQTVALPKRLPLVLAADNRGEDTSKDAKLVNGYMEKDALTNDFHLYKRPGTYPAAATIAGTGLGVFNWRGNIYRIQGATIYKDDVAIAGGAPNGALNTAGGVYRFSASLGTPAMQFGNGAASYNYDGTTLTTISGLNFTGTIVKGWAYLDGTTYVMNTLAEIKGCANLNDPTDWGDILNTIIAQIEPDAGVALAKQLVYVIALKQNSTEVFYDAQNPTASPLGPVQGAKIDYGCVSSDSVQDIDGALFWLATNKSAAAQIVMLQGLKVTVVSSKPIERLLGTADFSSIASFGIKYEGHRFYGLTIKNSNLTLVYDLAEGLWAQWTDAAGNYFPIVSSTYSLTAGQRLLQHESNGKLYLFDASYTTDDGSIITVDCYTPNFDGGTSRRKQMAAQTWIGDQTPGSILQVRHNDNDYAPTKWSQFRRVDMGQRKPMLTECGTFIRRAHHIRHQCATRLRLEAVDLQMDLGVL